MDVIVSHPVDVRSAARNEARRLAEESGRLAQTHQTAARRLTRAHLAFGLPATLLAGVTSVAAFAEAPIEFLGITSDQLAGVIALVVGVFSGMATFLDANRKASTHHAAWARYESIRHKALLLAEFEWAVGEVTVDPVVRDAATRLGQLTAELDEANATGP